MTAPLQLSQPNISPQLLQQQPSDEGFNKLLRVLLHVQDARQQRLEHQQQLQTQLGQLTLEQQKFDEEKRQTNEKQKQLKQLGEALTQQIQGAEQPQGTEAEILSTVATGDPQLIDAVVKKVERTKVQQRIREISKKYGGKKNLASLYAKYSELSEVDPQNGQFAQAATNFGLALAAGPDYTFQQDKDGNIVGFDRKTGNVKQTGVKGPPKLSPGLATLQQRVGPRVGPLMVALKGMRDIENTDSESVNQVAGAIASGKIKLGPLDVGAGIEWYKGLGFSSNAKKYAMFFAAAADNLIGMQYNVRSNVQVDLWKQSLIPLYGEAKQPDALHARQSMRENMAKAYLDVLSGKVAPEQAQGILKPDFFNGLQVYSADNPFKTAEQP